MNVALILAGGVGSRFGAKVPKQFVEVLGKPVLAYTIEAFERHPEVDAIIVACVKPYIDYVWKLRDKYGFDKLRWATEGGETFQGSVLNGIRFLEGIIDDQDIVLVHFGASPFVADNIITDAIRVCRKKGNAISTTDFYLLSGRKKTSLPVLEEDNYSDEYIDRETVAVMNTPHAFKFGFIRDMYVDAIELGIIEEVEPHTTSLMYAMGKSIHFSYGSQLNIKITRTEDLELFEGYVLEQRRKESEKTSGKVIVFLADGFEECEALLVVDILRRADIEVIMASITGDREVKSSRGVTVIADCLAECVDYVKAQMLVLPGGRTGVANLEKSVFVKEKCQEFAREKKVAAICAAPSVLASIGLLDGREATIHPDFADKMQGATVVDSPVVANGNIITGRGLGAAIPFALELVASLLNEEASLRIVKDICL